jgi:hypothetical protein
MPSAFSKLTEHDVAVIFCHVAADPLSAADARALHQVSRLTRRGYDCAVHAGWLPMAGHRSGGGRDVLVGVGLVPCCHAEQGDTSLCP